MNERNIIKKIVLVMIGLFMIVFLYSCSEEEPVVKKYYKTEVAKTWSIESSTNYVSYTQWVTEINLSAKSWWRIAYMWYELWDKVLKWEKLAYLDWAEAYISNNTATNIIWSLNNLKNSTSISYDEQINSLKQTLKRVNEASLWAKLWVKNSEKINLSEIKIYENKVEEAEINLQTQKVTMEETINVLNWTRENIYSWWENSITNSVILYTNIIKYIDELLWVTSLNRDLNDKFEDYLWTKKSDTYLNAKSYFTKINGKYLWYKVYYKEYIEWKTNISKDNILTWLKKWEILAADIKELLRLTYEVLDYSIDNVYLTIDEINNHKNIISNFWKDIESNLINTSWTYIFWLKWTIQNIDIFNRDYQKQIEILKEKITLAEKNIIIAEENLNNIKNLSKSNIDNLETQEKISYINIEEVKAQIKALKQQKLSKISEINTSISESVWNKNYSNTLIKDTQIISPIDWIIIQKFAEVWEVISPWVNIYKIADNSKIKLKVSIPYLLSDKLNLWKKVTIKLEWKNKQYIWFISNIPLSNDVQSKKTIIEVIIWNKNKEIKIWTMANVYFWEKSISWIIVPNNAIISKYMTTWIMVKDWNIAIFKEIKILNTDNNFSIVSWISALDEILIEWQENIWDGEVLNIN